MIGVNSLTCFTVISKTEGQPLLKRIIFLVATTHSVGGGTNSWLGYGVRESDLPEHTVVEMKAIKTGFYERFGFKDGRYNLVDYLYDKKKKLKDAIAARPCIIRAAMSDQLQQIEAPGINIYKQVEMYTKYLPVVPEEHWGDELCVKPSDEIIEATKDESRRR